MKAKIVTTVTTYLDIDTLKQEVEVDISDEDGVSDVSPQVLGAALIGSMRSVERGLRKQFRIPETVGQRTPPIDRGDYEPNADHTED